MNKQPVKLGKEDSQILLYAKGHFQLDTPKQPRSLSNRRPRTLEDIKLLIGYRAGCLGSQISDYDIIIVLTGLMSTLGLEKVMAGQKFMSKVIFDGEYGRPVRLAGEIEKTPIERFVHAVLDELSILQVVGDGPVDLIQYEPLDPDVFKYDMFGYDKDGLDRHGLDRHGRVKEA